jgi:hypothetical protein
MLKKLLLPMVLGLAMLVPGTALARDWDDHGRARVEFRERHRPRFRVYIGPSYGYGYRYYDRWGPYGGFYDRWGYWHPYN